MSQEKHIKALPAGELLAECQAMQDRLRSAETLLAQAVEQCRSGSFVVAQRALQRAREALGVADSRANGTPDYWNEDQTREKLVEDMAFKYEEVRVAVFLAGAQLPEVHRLAMSAALEVVEGAGRSPPPRLPAA